MPLLTKNRVVGIKAESTVGTAVTPVAADCALALFFDPKITAEVPRYRRQGAQVTLSQFAQISGARKGRLTMHSEVFGSGTGGSPTPSWATTLFPFCGAAVATNVVTPVTVPGSYTTCTAGIFQAGVLRRIVGAQGSFVIRGKVGEPLKIEWTFEGVLWKDLTLSIPASITYPTSPKPPRFAGATISVGGNSYPIDQFEFNAGVQIYVREDASAKDTDQEGLTAGTGGTGYVAAIAVDRDPTLKFSPEAQPLGTVDFVRQHLENATFAFSCAVGAAAGNTATLAVPVAQHAEAPQDGDRNGLRTAEIVLQANRNASAGDDEWSLTFS